MSILGRNMEAHRAVNSACNRIGRATQRASALVGFLCLFYGAAFAAFVPGSLETRTIYFVIFGLAPALAFYASGHILRQILGLSCKLCEIIAGRCIRLLTPSVNGILNWAGALVSAALKRHCLLITAQWMHTVFRFTIVRWSTDRERGRHRTFK